MGKNFQHIFRGPFLPVLGYIAVLLLPSFEAVAQTISWPEAVEIAKKNNPELAAADATLRAAGAQIGSARAGFFPKVSGSLSATRANSVVGNTSLPASNTYSAALTGSQNIFTGLADAARVDQAKANADSAEQEAKITKARISYELKTAFESFLYAQEYSAQTLEIMKRRKENLRLVQLRFDGGRENKGSVLLSQAYLSQAELDNLQAENTKRSAAADFARTLGLEEDPNLKLTGQVPLTEPGKREEFKSLALASPNYIQSLAQERSADAGITVAKSGFFPSLDLTGSYGRNDTVFFPRTADRWSTSLTLSIPLFSGGRDYYATKAAAANWESASLKAQDSARAQNAVLTDAFVAYQESAAKLKVDQGFRDAATVRAEIARTKYNNGLQTFEDWDTIENDLITRQKAYLQSKRARVTAEAAWEQAQGIGVLE
ncbi:MAG: TolC family protein [Bdellovibrionota bacterium]